MLLFHRFGGFALTSALGAVFAEDVAGEDFDFGHEVGGVGGVLEHGVDEVFFVADGFDRSISLCVIEAATKEGVEWRLKRERGRGDLLVSHVLSPGHIMLPLDQSRFVANVVPDGICKTSRMTRIESGRPGLFLDRLEKFMLIDCAIKLSENVLALIVSQLRGTIACYLMKLIVLVRGT